MSEHLTCRDCKHMAPHKLFRDKIICEERPEVEMAMADADVRCAFFEECDEDDIVERESDWAGWTVNYSPDENPTQGE